MKALSIKDILSNSKQKLEKIEVPEWGGYIHMRGMTAIERDQYDSSVCSINPDSGKRVFTYENISAKMLSFCICDENGKRLFTRDSDVLALGEQPANVLDRLKKIASRLSGMDDEIIEEKIKNLETPNGVISPTN